MTCTVYNYPVYSREIFDLFRCADRMPFPSYFSPSFSSFIPRGHCELRRKGTTPACSRRACIDVTPRP